LGPSTCHGRAGCVERVTGMTEREDAIHRLGRGLDLPPEMMKRWTDPNPSPGSYEACRLAAMAEHEAFVAGIGVVVAEVAAELKAGVRTNDR
jgi:hypothetical protein